MNSNGNTAEVIGFDFGHGETALTRVRMDNKDAYSDPELVEIQGKKNQITAIGYHPTKGILIGESALRTQGVTESYITFKKRPDGDPIYLKIMNDFITTILSSLIKSGKIESESTYFLVGCPSEWTNNPDLVEAYRKIFLNAGLKNIKVVSESRSALMHAIECGMLNIKEMKKPILVIDVGSSTTDFTLVFCNKKKDVPLDTGGDLGASAIEKSIFQMVLDQHLEKNQLIEIFNKHPHIRNGCELTCRKVKEVYFSSPDLYQEEGDYVSGGLENIQNKYYFEPKIDGAAMHGILSSQMIKLNGRLETWPGAFEFELKKRKDEIIEKLSEDVFPEIILLTGGASRMGFIPDICRKVFPSSVIKFDDSPEFCIAKGLARWGRVEISTRQLTNDIQLFCSNTIKPKIENRIGELYKSVSGTLSDKVIDIIKSNFYRWKSGSHSTVNGMKYSIDSEIKSFLSEDKLNHLLSGLIRDMLISMGRDFREDIKGLENKYGIPMGALGSSFNVERLKFKINLRNQDIDDPTKGMAEGFGAFVGVISGILGTVVAYTVVPIVLAIVVVIISFISSTLAGLIFAILVSNPGGWVILASIGIIGLAVGGAAKDTIKEKMPNWDLPVWVRNLIDSGEVYTKIDSRRSSIYNEIYAGLEKDLDAKQDLVSNINNAFNNSLKEAADDQRLLLIS